MYPRKYGQESSYGKTSDSPYSTRGSQSTSSSASLSSRYSSRILGSGGIFVSTRSRLCLYMGDWHVLPHDLLLSIMQQLSLPDLLAASRVCKHWNAVGFSDYLWKRYFQQNFHQDPSIPLSPRAVGGWRGEFARLVNEAPVMQCEVLREHRSYVLHVSFAKAGHLFATCSFDARVIVWSSEHPCQMMYQADLQRKYNWKFASFSEFNSTDTLLMVSGAYFGTGPFLTAGEVVIFDLEDDFRLLSRTKNRPYDLFGAWITDDYLVTGELKWLQNMRSTSTLLLIRSTQEISSEHVPILSPLLKLFNTNSACARNLMVAYYHGPPCHMRELSADVGETGDASHSILYTGDYYLRSYHPSHTQDDHAQEDAVDEDAARGQEERAMTPPQSLDNSDERLVIFTTGSKTYTPHQIGIIRQRPVMPESVVVEHDIAKLLRRKENIRQRVHDQQPANMIDYESVKQLCHPIDHTIEMHGNVVGMALSPDHRFLYVNCRPWSTADTTISPVTAPSIATHVDLHVFDLSTMTQVGRQTSVSEAFVSSDESYYIFPSVSHHYVASGGTKSGRLWDRHYGVCLAELPHMDSVSCVAINPADPCMMVTVSDDKTIKVWRSRGIARRKRIARAKEAIVLLPRPPFQHTKEDLHHNCSTPETCTLHHHDIH